MALQDSSYYERQQRYREMRDRIIKSRQQVVSDQDPNTNNEVTTSSNSAIESLVEKISQGLKRGTESNLPIPLPVKILGNLRAENDNKPTLPVPLPVSLDRNNNVVKAEVPTPLPVIVPGIATEETQKHVADAIDKEIPILKHSDQTLSKIYQENVTLNNNFSRYINSIVSGIEEHFTDFAESNRGWFGKMFSNSIQYLRSLNPFMEKTVDGLERAINPLYGATIKSTGYLKSLNDMFRKWFRAIQINMVRQSAEDGQPPSKLKAGAIAAYDMMFPDDSYMRKVIESTKKIASFYTAIGTAIGSAAGTALAPLLAMFARSGVGALAAIPKFITAMGGITKVVAGVVGIAAFASLYAMFKNPDQFVRMMEAFSNLWTKAIQPAIAWFVEELLPPLSVGFAGLVHVGEKLLDAVGTIINETLIKIIGEYLPNFLMFLGKQIDTIWQSIKELGLRVIGMFGIGPYGEEGFWKNLMVGIYQIPKMLVNLVDNQLAVMMEMLGAADILGLRDGEGPIARITRFWMEDVPTFISDTFDKIVVAIRELDPIETIKSKLKMFVDAIVGLIPSWDDVKGWLSNSIPSWVPDNIRNWFNEQISGEGQQPDKAPAAAVPSPMQRMFDAPISRSQLQSPIIVAPSLINNSSTNISNSGRSNIPSGIGTTQPERYPLDEMLYKISP